MKKLNNEKVKQVSGGSKLKEFHPDSAFDPRSGKVYEDSDQDTTESEKFNSGSREIHIPKTKWVLF